jgi:Zn-dependent M28 family amino/carboxypeptidase
MFGSSFYVANPAVPLDRTVSNLNMDMIGRVDSAHAATGPHYVYVIGSDKISTELDSILNVANRETERLAFDYTYNDEKDPNNFYRRSDHYNFAKNGIPVVFFFTGLHEDYHRPTDTADKLLYDRMASITRVVFTTAWKLAQMPRMLFKNVQ